MYARTFHLGQMNLRTLFVQVSNVSQQSQIYCRNVPTFFTQHMTKLQGEATQYPSLRIGFPTLVNISLVQTGIAFGSIGFGVSRLLSQHIFASIVILSTLVFDCIYYLHLFSISKIFQQHCLVYIGMVICFTYQNRQVAASFDLIVIILSEVLERFLFISYIKSLAHFITFQWFNRLCFHVFLMIM